MNTGFPMKDTKPYRPERDGRDIDQLLHRMPIHRAPPDFFASVLAAVELHAARPWYHRPWLCWPVHWQALSFLAASALITAWFWGVGVGYEAVTSMPMFSAMRAWSSIFASTAWTVARALILAARNMPTIWLGTVACILGAAWISCLGLGTACWRLARANA